MQHKFILMLFMVICSTFLGLFSALASAADPAEALQKVIDASRNNDASGISLDDLRSIEGLTDIRNEFIFDYRDIIADSMDPDDDEYVVSLQEFIDAINSTPPDAAVQTVNNKIEDKWTDARYTVNDDSTVIDTVTKLMWHVCSAGQTLTAGVCEDPVEEDIANLVFTWKAALQFVADQNASGASAGYTDWRLPNIKELASLLARNRYSPAVNLTVFPDILKDFYWSASPSAQNTDQSWQASTLSGEVLSEIRSGDGHVFMVRDVAAP